MTIALTAIAILGILVDIVFIRSELSGRMVRATVLKGCASAFFVAFGLVCYGKVSTAFGRLILIGLILGMLGDILLNLRNNVSEGASKKVFALGILAFLSGHFLYIAALIGKQSSIVLLSALITAVLSVLCIPPLMKRIEAPSKGLKIFGYVYLVIVIAMFSCALMSLIQGGASAVHLVFTLGAFLFVVSDFIMIYYSFGKKIPALRVTNLLAYYVGQLLIALCILLIG